MKFSVFILITTTITTLIHNTLQSGNVDYKTYDLDTSPKDIIWCGSNSDTVLALTEANSLYRSDDKGFNWKKLNDIMSNTGKEQLEPSENDIGKVSEIILSPVDKNLVIFLGTHGINWVSEDCGRKIKAMNHGRKIQEFIFHPTKRNWVLASAYTLCEDFGNEPCKKYKEVFVTKDLGENWELLLSYVVQFGWGITGKAHVNAGVPEERILVTYEPRGRGDQKHLGWNYKIDFIYSDDFFKTKRIASHKGNKFLLTDNYLFVAQVVDQDEQEVMLLLSDSRHKLYNFDSIHLNNSKFREHSYTFLDTTEQTVFLHINHFGENSKYGHVYISDSNGMRYSLSLPYNVRSFDNQCDFEKLNGLDGIYIANTIDKDYMKNQLEEIQREELEDEERMDEKKHKKTKGGDAEDEAHKDFIKTLISFNKGGNWLSLKAPERDIDGKLYECGNDCNLNLHGISGDFPPFYSVNSAAGIILGNGNIGQFLSHNSDEISTFLSRDGGNSWFEVRKGSHIYEIGDHGALLVIADDQHPTDTIQYSWDEGLQWQDLRISTDKIMIKNIIIEPNSASMNFVVYGESLSRKGKKNGIVVGVNFSSLHEPRCRSPDDPDTPNSDYEKWSPSDGRQNHPCLLGQKTIYVRRKRDAECYNGDDFERKKVVDFCSCTEFDYECDEGFTRETGDSSCNPINSDTHKLPLEGEIHKAPEICNGYFTISRGYRKVPGNHCVNGVKFDPLVVNCPYNGIFSSIGMILFMLIIFAMIVLVYMAFNQNFVRNVTEFVESKMSQNNNSNNIYNKYIDIVSVIIIVFIIFLYFYTYYLQSDKEDDNLVFGESDDILNNIEDKEAKPKEDNNKKEDINLLELN